MHANGSVAFHKLGQLLFTKKQIHLLELRLNPVADLGGSMGGMCTPLSCTLLHSVRLLCTPSSIVHIYSYSCAPPALRN